VDDVVVKTRNSDMLITDLEETFASLREYRWKLNPNKCVFGVPSGKLLSFIISHRGIKDNPVVWTSLGPLPRWVPGPTTRWAPGTTRLALHGT
jgi:hypothetical protein